MPPERCAGWVAALSVRARNVLSEAGIVDLWQLVASSDRSLIRIENCGKVTLRELRAHQALLLLLRGQTPLECIHAAYQPSAGAPYESHAACHARMEDLRGHYWHVKERLDAFEAGKRKGGDPR